MSTPGRAEKRKPEDKGTPPKRKRLKALSGDPDQKGGLMSFKKEPSSFPSLAAIKKEPVERPTTNHTAPPLTEEYIREKILKMLKEHQSGFGNQVLFSALPNVDNAKILLVLNDLLKKGKIQVLQTSDKKLIYKLKTVSNAVAEASTLEESLILENITNAGNKGVSNYELKRKINIGIMILNRMLKDLEKRKIIKGITIGSSKKKVYMLSSITPDASLTGDALFGDKDLESGMVDEMCRTCLQYLQTKYEDASAQPNLVTSRNSALASSKEIFDELSKRNITNKDLEVSHVERLLFKLVLSGDVEKVARAGSFHPSYRYIPPSQQAGGPSLGYLPCSTCQHIDVCGKPHSLVQPSTCVYMQEWLDF